MAGLIVIVINVKSRKSNSLNSRVEEERCRPSPLFKPDLRISRIRLTEGVSSVSTRSPRDCHESTVNPDDDTDVRINCDRPGDDSHVDFDDAGEPSCVCTLGNSPWQTHAVDGRSQSIDSSHRAVD